MVLPGKLYENPRPSSYFSRQTAPRLVPINLHISQFKRNYGGSFKARDVGTKFGAAAISAGVLFREQRLPTQQIRVEARVSHTRG